MRMTLRELTIFVTENRFRIVRGFPELKTQSRVLWVSDHGDLLKVQCVGEQVFDCTYIKYDEMDDNSWLKERKIVKVFNKNYSLATLVAYTWLEPDEDPQKNKVLFKNGNTRDIRASNLAWTSRSTITKKSCKTRKPRTFKGKWRDGYFTDKYYIRHEMSYSEYLDMIERERGLSARIKLERDRTVQQEKAKAKRWNLDRITNVNCSKSHQ